MLKMKRFGHTKNGVQPKDPVQEMQRRIKRTVKFTKLTEFKGLGDELTPAKMELITLIRELHAKGANLKRADREEQLSNGIASIIGKAPVREDIAIIRKAPVIEDTADTYRGELELFATEFWSFVEAMWRRLAELPIRESWKIPITDLWTEKPLA